MGRKELLNKIRFHWASYVARGGFDQPVTLEGRLEKGGIEHWYNFLKHGRDYVSQFGVMDIDFINRSMIRMLTGA